MKYDVAVIGSGPAGYNCAVRFRQLGKKVVIIEKNKIGGICVNAGCIPTKFLWQAANAKRKILKSSEYGIKSKLESVNFQDVINKKNKAVENIIKGIQKNLENHGIDVIYGISSFKDNTRLIIRTGQKEIELSADKIIIATGSESKTMPGVKFDHNKYIDSTDALNLAELPKTMLVIGGGAVGVELSSIFSIFGCDVTLREIYPQLLPNEDRELADEVAKNLSRQGVRVEVGCNNSLNDEDKFEKILIAAGRASTIDELDVHNIGLEVDNRNYVISKNYSTNVENIFAVGDIIGKNFLAYTAEQDGINVVANVMKQETVKTKDPIPKVVFSFPPAASVKNCDFDKYTNVVYGKFNFSANARAQIEGERTGWIKVAVDKDSQKILGMWIVGANADELINTASVMIKANVNVKDLSKNMFFHPGFGEMILDAVNNIGE